jgi:hypothetical protein
LHHWPDGTVVFDDSNGNLQCLAPASGVLLAVLTGGARQSSVGLAEELLGEAPTSDEFQMVENILAEFSSLNFVERLAA